MNDDKRAFKHIDRKFKRIKTQAERDRDRIDSRVHKTLIEAGVNVGKLKESQKKSPSQRKSESARKHEIRRANK
jgi:hypothetical protein